MASRPFFDPAGRGRWRISYHDGRRWRKATLGPHPAAWERHRPPARPPESILRAAREYQDLEAAARRGEPAGARDDRLEPFLRAYQAAYALGHAPASRSCLKVALDHFRAHVEASGLDRLSSWTEAECRRYLERRIAAKAARATVATERSFLSPLFARAVDDGLIPANPWARARVPGRQVQEEAPFWTREELERLIAAADDTWCRDFIVVAANTGLRCASMTGLLWDDVRLDRGVVVVRAGLGGNKGARRYEVPLTAAARSCLEARARKWDLVFGDDATGKVVGNRAVYGRLHRVVLRAGLPEKGRYVHTLRDTFATHAILAGVPLAVVSRWLGHASVQQTMKYQHLAPQDHQDQVARFNLPASPPGPP